MSRKVYYKDGIKLYTPYECKANGISTKSLRKVVRTIDKITTDRYFGRLDIPVDNWEYVGMISTKQLRNPKVARQLDRLNLA